MKRQGLGVSKRWKVSNEKTELLELHVATDAVPQIQHKKMMKAEELGDQGVC